MTPLLLSVYVSLFATMLAGAIGVLLAAVLANGRFVGRDLLDAILATPLVLPPTVLGYALLVSLGRTSALGRAFEALTGSSIVFSKTGAVVAAALGALPLVVKTARAAFEGVDPRLVLAARTLGASKWQAFVRIELPLARRGIAAAITLAFARSLGDFGATLVVAGDIPGDTRTASLAIYDAIQAHREAEATGYVLLLSAIAIFAMVLVTKLTERDAKR